MFPASGQREKERAIRPKKNWPHLRLRQTTSLAWGDRATRLSVAYQIAKTPRRSVRSCRFSLTLSVCDDARMLCTGGRPGWMWWFKRAGLTSSRFAVGRDVEAGRADSAGRNREMWERPSLLQLCAQAVAHNCRQEAPARRIFPPSDMRMHACKLQNSSKKSLCDLVPAGDYCGSVPDRQCGDYLSSCASTFVENYYNCT